MDSLHSLLKQIAQELQPVSGYSSYSEAEWLLLDLLQYQERALLYLSPPVFPQDLKDKINYLIKLRKKRIPLQYLLGYCYFYGLKFYLRRDVFIPRPETEVMLDYVIRNYNDFKKLYILEIGVGCGNIAISLTKFLPNCKIIATDISEQSLELARLNASLHAVDICFVRGDKLSPFKEKEFFDLIISNPPYIKDKDLLTLQPEVRKEPSLALKGGKKGCDFVFHLITEGVKLLKDGGKMVLEINSESKILIEHYLKENSFNSFTFLKDLEGKERVVIIDKDG